VWQRFGVARFAQGVLFGVGAALMLDEFCLILFVEDDYWAVRGVLVSEAAIILGGVVLFANVFLGRRFYGAVGQHSRIAVQNVWRP
jgi:hypothetical protein